jgi:hypothetical protein
MPLKIGLPPSKMNKTTKEAMAKDYKLKLQQLVQLTDNNYTSNYHPSQS